MSSYQIFPGRGEYSSALNADPWRKLMQDRARQVAGSTSKKKAAPKKTTSSGAPSDPYKDTTAQIDAMIATWVTQVQQQQAQARAQAEAEAAQELAKGQALADGLKQLGISGAIQSIFQNAGNNQAALASGFSGQIRDQAAAQAAEQQRMLSGTGQEGAVRQQGENMGNVQYGLGGAIPASTLNTQGANFAAEAALQPGFALEFAQLAQQQRMNDYVKNELPDFTQQISDIYAKRPELLQDAISDLQKQAASPSATSTKATYRNLSNGQIGVFQNGKMIRVEGPAKVTTTKTEEGDYGTEKLANGQYVTTLDGKPISKPWGPKKTSSSSGSGGSTKKDLAPEIDAVGDEIVAYDKRTGKVLWRKKRPTQPGQTTTSGGARTATATQRKNAGKIASQAWNGVKAGKDDDGNQLFTYMSYQEAMREGLAQGIPLATMQASLNRYWTKPGMQTERDDPGQGRPVRSFQERNPAKKAPKSTTLPTSWSGTHVTDGLDWNHGEKTAIDLYVGKKPGTPVGSPVSGTVVYFRPEGAQGGGSMLIRGDDGYEYWLGHIANGVPAGTKIRRGTKIAVIANQSVSAPHVHLDRKYVGSRA